MCVASFVFFHAYQEPNRNLSGRAHKAAATKVGHSAHAQCWPRVCKIGHTPRVARVGCGVTKRPTARAIGPLTGRALMESLCLIQGKIGFL